MYFQNNIYVSGLILLKLANDFNLSSLSPTFVKKKVFSVEHMKSKGLPIKLIANDSSWLDFFCLLHCIHIHFEIAFWMTKGT